METYLQTLSECLPGGFDELPLWRRTAHALYPSKALKFIEAMISRPALQSKWHACARH